MAAGVAVAAGLGDAMDVGDAFGTGETVAVAIGVGVGVAVGFGVAVGVGVTLGVAVGIGEGVKIGFAPKVTSQLSMSVPGDVLSNELLLGGIFPIFVPIAIALYKFCFDDLIKSSDKTWSWHPEQFA